MFRSRSSRPEEQDSSGGCYSNLRTPHSKMSPVMGPADFSFVDEGGSDTERIKVSRLANRPLRLWLQMTVNCHQGAELRHRILGPVTRAGHDPQVTTTAHLGPVLSGLGHSG